jgi:hypothetical protein
MEWRCRRLRQEAGLRVRAGITLFIVFVSVLFIVKSDSKRMTAIEYPFHNRVSTICATGMASRAIEPSH